MLMRAGRTKTGRQPEQAGFTLIELMIALAVSLIVVGAAVSLAVNISQAATQSTLYARTTQDMRTLMSVMSREIKRAGYNVNGINRIGTGLSSPNHSLFLSNQVSGIASCVMFGYDTLDVGNGTRDSTPGVLSAAEESEWRGFRRVVVDGVGVLQMRLAGAGVATGCAGGGHTWTNLSDPDTLDITELRFDMTRVAEAVAGTVNNPATNAPAIALIGVRPVLITLRARSPADPGNVRELRQWTRVRADTMRLVPVPPPPTP